MCDFFEEVLGEKGDVCSSVHERVGFLVSDVKPAHGGVWFDLNPVCSETLSGFLLSMSIIMQSLLPSVRPCGLIHGGSP